MRPLLLYLWSSKLHLFKCKRIEEIFSTDCLYLVYFWYLNEKTFCLNLLKLWTLNFGSLFILFVGQCYAPGSHLFTLNIIFQSGSKCTAVSTYTKGVTRDMMFSFFKHEKKSKIFLFNQIYPQLIHLENFIIVRFQIRYLKIQTAFKMSDNNDQERKIR